MLAHAAVSTRSCRIRATIRSASGGGSGTTSECGTTCDYVVHHLADPLVVRERFRVQAFGGDVPVMIVVSSRTPARFSSGRAPWSAPRRPCARGVVRRRRSSRRRVCRTGADDRRAGTRPPARVAPTPLPERPDGERPAPGADRDHPPGHARHRTRRRGSSHGGRPGLPASLRPAGNDSTTEWLRPPSRWTRRRRAAKQPRRLTPTGDSGRRRRTRRRTARLPSRGYRRTAG